MATIHLTLLGTFSLCIDSAAITDFRSDKARCLLAYLAAESGKVHRRADLATLFWADQPDAAAKANLRNVLSNLRACFQSADDSPLHITRHDVSFNALPQQVDVVAFEDLLAQAHATTLPQVDLLQKAVDLYNGDFLAGLAPDDAPGFQEWRVIRQERLHHRAMEALEVLSAYYAAQGDYEQLAESARQQLQLTPWHEPAYRRLIQALASLGMHAAALEVYERCCKVLAEELGIEPDEATQSLMRRIQGEDVNRAHRIRPRNNIPLITTSFLGRDANLASLLERCKPEQERLVTLLGIGGVGKSRLAAAVGQQMQQIYTDGVCWVALENVQPGDEAANRLVVALAAGLDLALVGDEPIQQQVLDHLRPRRLLLILDNFEHLVAEAGFVLTILTHAPHVSLLVTSRVRLNLPGERVMVVRGFSPEAGAALFVHRAQAVNANFTQNAENRPHIDRICRAVEGLPLGIELAAVWTEHFTCAEIADAIAENRDFLARQRAESAGSTGNAFDRHDSLRTVYEHSWRLLPTSEQRALAKIAVFHGEFSREAFLAVTAATLSDLSALMSKSLVRLVEAGRYTVHEVVRSFSAQKLAQWPAVDQSETLQHYRRWYLGRLQSHTTTNIQPDLENIRAAWIHAVAERDHPLLLAAAEQFADLWQAMGLLRDGNELLKLALTIGWTDDDTAGDLAAALLLQVSIFTQQIDGASAALDAAYQGLTQTENPGLRTRLYRRAAILLGETQRWDEAVKAHQHHVVEARRSGDRRLLALALHEQAHTQVLHFVGDFAQAIERMELALHLIEDDPESGNMRANILCGLAIANIRHGDYGRAIAYARQILSLGQALNRRNDQIEALIYLGLAHSFAGLHSQAITYAEEGLVTAEAAGDREGIGLLKANLCLIQRNTGNLESSLAYGEAALSLLQALAIRRMEGLCRNRLGHTLLALTRYAEAAEMYAAACEIWQRLGNPNLYEALAGQAIALSQLGQNQEALHLIEEVLNFAVDDDSLQRVVEPVQMLLHCAQVLQLAGKIDRARAILRQAQNWMETIASRNADAVVRQAYLYNIHAHQQVRSALASNSFILGTV